MNPPINHARPPVLTHASWVVALLNHLDRRMLRVLLPACCLAASVGISSGAEELTWRKLSPLPDREGFAGSFGGTHRGALVVAGGANFPGKKPWEGGAKVWHDTIFVLDAPTAQWRMAGRLPRPLGYGVSVTTSNGIVLAGGSDANGHHAGVFLLRPTNGAPRFTPLPSLPRPCANASGALLGGTLFIAGGIERPDATQALKTFWSLDLSQADATWRELESWPGAGRMLATAGSAQGSFYLFSGAAQEKGADGKAVRRWLRDAYQFTPGRGWKRIADLPRVAVAAPSPAPLVGDQLLLIGGDDGAQVNAPPTVHRGFLQEVLAYKLSSRKWSTVGETPFALVTTPSIEWNGHIVIPGGEVRPGVRSTEVWSATRVKQ